MNIQIRPFFVILSLGMIAALSGCTSALAEGIVPPPAEDAVHSAKAERNAVITRAGTATALTDSIAWQLALVESNTRIWREAYRKFRNIRETENVHSTAAGKKDTTIAAGG
ncbi:MAG TPA: hypothetical protein PLO06_00590 [Methanoregulaceae archaeon]|nr:hypothetical protein [Methanoregulaceae archaeon]HPD75293.1 hypothetical protein [Methanoregulaceae archaeon]